VSDDSAFARKPGRHGKVRVLLTTVIVGLTVLVIGGLFGWSNPTWTAIFAGITVVMGIAHLIVAFRLPTRRGFERKKNLGQVSIKQIRASSANIKRRFSHQQIRRYANALLQPNDMRGRLIEEVEPLKRALQQRVSITVDMSKLTDKERAEDLLFPVLMPVKGELQDNLRITLDGQPVATLTHHEYLLLTEVVLDALLVPVNGLTAEQIDELGTLTDQALAIVCRRGRLESPEDKAKIREYADAIAKLATNEVTENFKLAAGLLRLLAENYVIVVVIAAKKDLKRQVTYERYIIPTLKLARWTSPHKWVRDYVRAFLGARPVFLELPLLNAVTAQSYHLFVMGPDGMYVGWQDVPKANGLFSNPSLDEDLIRPYARFQRRKGQRYLHLYTRSVEAKDSQLQLDVRFYEVPPGSTATSAMAATTNCVLVFVVAFILQAQKAPMGSDFPAVVLAFPAIAGAFAGFESRTTALVGGVLSTKATALLTVFLSLAASGLFMANTAHSMELTDHPGIFGIKDVWWQILVVATLVNALCACYVWMARTLSFYWLAHRPGDDTRSGHSEE
jgi:hypothetical protein